jgi:4-amino-4-deoxy-L-arabinose transferase-like glycosyltransferase
MSHFSRYQRAAKLFMIDRTTGPERSVRQSDMNPFGERGWAWLLCLVCLVVLFSNLGSGALFEPDEGRNAEKAREILLLNNWVTPYQNFLPTLDKPIAYYWLVALSFKFFGFSEWSARLPSVLAACGCLFLVYRFARLQWGTWEALWSCLVLVTSVEFFVLSRVVIFDMALTFFITWALFSFYKTVRANDSSSAKLSCIFIYAAMGLGTLIKGPVALVVPSIVIFGYLLFTRKWFLLKRLNILLGALVYLAIVAPWYLWVEARNPGYLRYFLWEEHFVRYLTPRFSRTKSWYYFFIVLVVGFIPWTFLIPQTLKNLSKRKFYDADLFLALWVILPFAFFSVSNSKLPHYILPIYPPLALLGGRAVAVGLDGPSSRRWWALYLPWILTLGSVVYLIIGSTSPNLLASQIRDATVQKVYVIVPYGVTIFFVFGVFALGNLRKVWKDQGGAYLCTAIGLALFWFLVGQIMAVASFHRASKSLAAELRPLLNSQDRLVFYDTYVEGVPFYLRIDKPIWLVQAREKGDVMGSYYVAERRPTPAAGYGQVLFTFEEFAEQWKKNAPSLKVFVKEKNFARLSRELGAAPKLLMKFNGYLLVTNR